MLQVISASVITPLRLKKFLAILKLNVSQAEINEVNNHQSWQIFFILAENLIQMLQSEHNKEMREVDSKFEELKNRIPPHILKMKMGDVMMMTDFNELLIDEKMNSLNMTVKETVMKADEGKCDSIYFMSMFVVGAHFGSSFHTSMLAHHNASSSYLITTHNPTLTNPSSHFRFYFPIMSFSASSSHH